MHVLTKEEIRFIAETVDKAGINVSHLYDDLLDHLCCEVEFEIENGLNFKQAFEKIKTAVGLEDLQRVQVNTLLLIDKNYRIMKTIMKVSGAISTTLLMFGSLFKIMHWPGATIMLVTGFTLMCFLFLPSAMYVMNRENKDVKRPLLYLFAFLGSFGFTMGCFFKLMHWPGTPLLLISGVGILTLFFLPTLLVFLLQQTQSTKEKRIYTQGVISGIIYLLAFLFKMMHWPGASILLVAGASVLLFLFIVPYTVYHFKNETYVKAKFIYLIAASTWFILFTMLLALTVQSDVLTAFEHTDEKLTQSIKMYELKNNEVYYSSKDSNNLALLENIKNQSDELVKYIHNLKLEMIYKFYEGKSFDNSFIIDETTLDIKQWRSGGRANYFIPQHIMLGEEGKGEVQELKSKIELYRNNLISYVENNSPSSELIQTLLKTSVPSDTPEWLQSWEEYYFKKITIVACINVLSCIQRDIRVAESETLSYVITN